MKLQEFDSQYRHLRVHGWEGGSGFPLLLVHGSGPGASTLGNWRLIIDRLADQYHVIAIDLIGFGLSARKPQQPYFDPELWVSQILHMLDWFGKERIGVLGHSISGALALKAAARDSRIVKVMTTGTMGGRFRINEGTERVWTFPDGREEIRRVGETIVYDKSVITEAYVEGRVEVLQAPGYREYFSTMFAGDKQAFVDAMVLTEADYSGLGCDLCLVHGRDDLPFPPSSTEEIGARLPHADIHYLARCSHSPALEHPDKLLAIAQGFFG